MKVIKPVNGSEFFPLVLAFLLATSCGGRVYLVSSLGPAHAIVVDGNMDDWSGALSYVAKDHLFVGFVNDHNDLFICLTKETSEGRGPGRMGGWTVWIDPAGGSRKTMGIRIAPPGGPQEERPSEEGPERRPVEKPAEGEPGGQPLTIDRGADLEILGPSGNVLRKLSPEAAAKEGLEVGTGFSGGSFVLEVKIPLKASEGHPIAVGAGPSGQVGIGFLSSRADRKDRRAGQPGGEMGGGRVPGARGVGAMGGPSGMRGALPPNMDPDISKDIKVWTRVRLNQSEQPGRSTILGLITE
ncbi:MAG: hypothetical protein ACXW2H_05220 [Candidatus Aminicenantales bacterium]